MLLLRIPKISKKWVPLIKSLTILDLLLENDLQVEGISEMALDALIKFQPSKPKKLATSKLIQTYVNSIKEKSKVYLFQPLRLSSYKSDPNPNSTTIEFTIFQPLHDSIYEVIDVCEQGFLKYPLIQSLFEHFSEVLHGYYILQLDTFKYLSQKFFSFNLKKAQEVRANCALFLKNTQSLISFVNKHQFMKFQQQVKNNSELELLQPKQKMLQSFDDYIAVQLRKQEIQTKFETSCSNIETEGQIDQNFDCDVLESDRDFVQRKQDIFISPIKAHFMNKPEKAWQSNSSSPHKKERFSLPEPLLFQSPDRSKDTISSRIEIFHFAEKTDLFCPEVFDQFENTYSQTYRGSMIEIQDYEVQNFELQMKFSAMGKMLFRRQTLDLSEKVEFINPNPFKPRLFKDFKNFYSKEFDKKSVIREEAEKKPKKT